jgi:hypothetical protein
MKKLLLLLLQVIVCSVFCKAQQQSPPNSLWLYGSGGTSWEYGFGLGTDDSGYHYISGRFDSTISFQGTGGPVTATFNGGSGITPFVGKFDENGNCLWLAQHDIGFDYPRGFCTDRALHNNEYVVGNVNSGDGMFVDKFDNLGNFKWAATLGTTSGNGYGGSPNADAVAADSSGNVYVTGETGDGSWAFIPTGGAVDDDSVLTCGTAGTYWPQDQEMFLTKLDKNGNFLWAIGTEDANGATSYDVGRWITLDKTGQYVFVCGGYQNTASFHSRNSSGDIIAPTAANGTSSLFIAKYDSAGNLIWLQTATNAGIPWINGFKSGVTDIDAVTVDSCGNLFMTGFYNGSAQFGPFTLTATGTQDGFVGSLNSLGQWQWVDDIGSALKCFGSTIALDKDNDVYIGGSIQGTANFGNGVSLTATASPNNLFIAKYSNSNGAVQWAQSSSGTGNNYVWGLHIDSKKFEYVSGTFNGTFDLPGTDTLTSIGSEQNFFIAKLDTVPALYIVPVVDSSYCPGETTTLTYTVTGTFHNGNVFTAELSDSTGSFVNATIIGTVNSTTGGTITITIPANTPPGSAYLIRVVSSNPATSSYVNGCGSYYQANVYINNFYVTIGKGSNLPVALSASPGNTICKGSQVVLTVSGGTSYLWANNGDTSSVITVKPTTDSTFSVTVTNGECSKDTSITIIVNSNSPLTILPQSDSICIGQSITLSVPVSGSDYVWSPSSTLNSSTGDTVVASPYVTTTYIVTGINSFGCSVSGIDTVTVNFTIDTITIKGDTLISSAIQGNQWYWNGTLIPGATNQTYIATINGVYFVTTSQGCGISLPVIIGSAGINWLSATNNQLSIYPNPTSGQFNIKLNGNQSGCTIEVYNLMGEKVYQSVLSNSQNTINISTQPGGMYFVYLKSDQGVEVRKVMVVK